MPLYDCMLLVTREAMAELVALVARCAYQRNGVVTDVKSFGKVQLGYGIKKLDSRHYQMDVLLEWCSTKCLSGLWGFRNYHSAVDGASDVFDEMAK
ncbi:uncharacterized protein C2845_PM04G06570 [Panicum miliaceum]|uniref:Uncharacterized protein n=1 Tax=Panicum miliaceum TaxID=4540 RepID=A0A3L6QU59_PANMI|nr:uncharacterized protein C2845_PM04G06570 [Panicum miliaceum]